MTFLNTELVLLDESTSTSTNTSAQTVSTTRAIIAGSEIQYTPDTNATHVLYQCAFQFANLPDVNTHFFISVVEKVNAGDPWSYITDRSFAISFLDSSQACGFENIEVLLDTWSGSKYLALYIRSSVSSTEGRLHQLKMDASGFNTGNENFVDTLVSATSLKSY